MTDTENFSKLSAHSYQTALWFSSEQWEHMFRICISRVRRRVYRFILPYVTC